MSSVMNPKCLVMEMGNNLAKHVKELSTRFLSKKAIGAIVPPKTYESNFVHHDFVQFGKEHSQFKTILPSVVLSQQCCDAYFISLTVVTQQWDLTNQILLNSSPPTLLALSAPAVSFTGKRTLSYVTPIGSIDDIIGESERNFSKE